MLLVQKYYRHTSRELKRISSVTLSPIYAHFSETVTGIVTIRALRQLQRCVSHWFCRLHLYSKTLYFCCKCILISQSWNVEITLYFNLAFLLHDATQSTVMPQYVVRLSVRLSVTFRYRDHIGWNTSKIISRPNSLRPLLGLTPTWAIWCNGNTPKIRVE